MTFITPKGDQMFEGWDMELAILGGILVVAGLWWALTSFFEDGQ